MQRGETTLIEVILNQELGEPFRRDAMKKPVRVAGIDARTCGRRLEAGLGNARTGPRWRRVAEDANVGPGLVEPTLANLAA